MIEECQCTLTDTGNDSTCPIHSNIIFKSTPSLTFPDVMIIGNNSFPVNDTHDARDHPCLEDGKEHNWYDLNEMYKKCSKCGMSYEKPASKDFYI